MAFSKFIRTNQGRSLFFTQNNNPIVLYAIDNHAMTPSDARTRDTTVSSLETVNVLSSNITYLALYDPSRVSELCKGPAKAGTTRFSRCFAREANFARYSAGHSRRRRSR